MIKQPALVRDRILSDVAFMLRALYTRLTLLPDTEHDVLIELQSPKDRDLAIEITNLLMGKCGHQTSAENRFDKTRRALAKKQPKNRGFKSKLAAEPPIL
jgi:hypothetical protein